MTTLYTTSLESPSHLSPSDPEQEVKTKTEVDEIHPESNIGQEGKENLDLHSNCLEIQTDVDSMNMNGKVCLIIKIQQVSNRSRSELSKQVLQVSTLEGAPKLCG